MIGRWEVRVDWTILPECFARGRHRQQTAGEPRGRDLRGHSNHRSTSSTDWRRISKCGNEVGAAVFSRGLLFSSSCRFLGLPACLALP